MTEIYETQSERTDLPLVVMPSVLDSMIEPIKAQFPALHDVARVRMFEEFTSDEATIAERLKDADALLVGGYHISDDLLRTISGQGHVKCIVFCGTGVASYLNLDKARELKIRVCNAEHYGDHAVAEHTFALLFELIRRVGQLDKDVKAGNWAWASGDGLQLAGRRMGIIGLGGIGSTVAGIARAFGMKLVGYDPYCSPERAEQLGVTLYDDIDEILPIADFITVHLPRTVSTLGMFGADEFAAMKDGVRIVNLARGELVDTEALKAALASGKCAAYVTDFPNNKILQGKNVVAIPHLGASTPESEENCAVMAAQQLRDYLENGNITHSVNYPACDMGPRPAEGGRIAVLHANVPNMISQISGALADAGANIANLTNKARGEHAYTLIDTDAPVADEALGALRAIEGVRRVRAIG